MKINYSSSVERMLCSKVKLSEKKAREDSKLRDMLHKRERFKSPPPPPPTPAAARTNKIKSLKVLLLNIYVEYTWTNIDFM